MNVHYKITIFLMIGLGCTIAGMDNLKNEDLKQKESTLFQFFNIDYSAYTTLPPDMRNVIEVCDIKNEHLWQEKKWLCRDTSSKHSKYDREKSIVFFNNATGVLATTQHSSVYFFDVKKKSKISSMGAYGRLIFSGCFNSSGTHVALGLEHFIYVYDIEKNSKIAEFFHEGENRSVCFNYVGNCIAAGSGKKVCIFDSNSSKKISFKLSARITSLCFSADDKCLVVGTKEKDNSRDYRDYGKAYIFDIQTKRMIKKTINGLWVCSVLNNKSSYAMGSRYRTCLFNREQKRKSAKIRYIDRAYSFCSESSGAYAARGTSKNVIIIDTHKAINRAVFTVWSPIESVCFDASGNYLAASSNSGIVWLFERYHACCLRQLMLLKIINLWLRVQRPNKGITTFQGLLWAITTLFCFDYEFYSEMENAFALFPKKIQEFFLEKVSKNIHVYGKY